MVHQWFVNGSIAATRRLVGGSAHVFILIHRQGDLEQTSGKGFTQGGSRQGLKSKTVKLEQTNCKGEWLKKVNKARTLNKQVAMAKRKGNKAKTLNKQVAMAKKRGNKASSQAKQQLEQEGGGEQAHGLKKVLTKAILSKWVV